MCLEKSEFLFLVECKPKGFIREETILNLLVYFIEVGLGRQRKGIFKIRETEWTGKGEERQFSKFL